jgi:hypothetical protein
MSEQELHGKIKVTKNGYGSEVWVDGKKLPGIRQFTVGVGAGGMSVLKVEFILLNLEIEGDFDVVEHYAHVAPGVEEVNVTTVDDEYQKFAVVPKKDAA